MATTAIFQRGMEAAVSNNNAVLLKAKLQHIKSTWMSILYANSKSLSLIIEETCQNHPYTFFQGIDLSK
jgi:hypothetical protein